MKTKKTWPFLAAGVAIALLSLGEPAFAPAQIGESVLDAKVKAFLEKMQWGWRDMNVPEADGQVLHDIVIKNGYKRALEIGTSTGHSGLWIAWALAKTGGKLITIDIDEGRHSEAVANFKAAGLDSFTDARLADAHELVPALAGPWDFVFIDADKEWYTEYAKAVIPKVVPGGCIAAHNVSPPRGGGRFRGSGGGTGEYYQFIIQQPEFETSFPSGSRNDLSVSYKKK
jgi:predicted O-methyltransferase YrrM